MRCFVLGGFAALAMLAPCQADDGATFRSPEWGLSVHYPADLATSKTFKPNAFDRGAWRASYAADVGSGTPIVAFVLPDIHVADEGGTSEATAELRIGASRDPDVLATCLTYGMNSGDNIEEETRVIAGIPFTEIPDNRDGHGSQRIVTDDLRALHKGVCWAIDIVIYAAGTSNKRPDYTEAQLDRLRRVLGAIAIE